MMNEFFQFQKISEEELAGTVHGKADKAAVNILICVDSSSSEGENIGLMRMLDQWCSVVEIRLAFQWPKGHISPSPC
jgi:hypothetical protein